MSALPRVKVERVTTACRNCRQRKVRCSGGDPCKDCVRLSKECIYPPVQRRKRKHQDYTSTSSSRNNQSRSIEMVWNAQIVESRQSVERQSSPLQTRSIPSENSDLGHCAVGTGTNPASLPSRHHEDAFEISNELQIPLSGEADCESELSSFSRAQSAGCLRDVTSKLDAEISGSPRNHDDSQDLSENADWEYHEPWSWTSVCSETGSKWICGMTGNREFIAVAKRFTKDLVRRSSYNKYLSTGGSHAEPDEPTARKYVDAFYQNCWEADLGIIDHTDFEADLEFHYHNQNPRNDPAWLALRNVVFACGYRSLLAKVPTISFAVGQAKAGRYFEAAMSVFTKLLLPPSSVTAVRALILMACYVEGLGNPALKYFLCSNAVHVAQSKGLHRQPDRAWGNCESSTLKRNWLWWTVYALEKHLALCSGRPSAIDDDNVSAHVPGAIPTGSNIHSQSLTIAIRHARLHSQISRRLLSSKALAMQPRELIKTVNYFHDQLKEVLDEMPAEFRIGTLARPLYSTRRLIHILYLHFSIYGSLMAVHAHFFYPWLTSRFDGDGYDAELETQIASSSATVAEATRKIILALRLVNTNLTTPSWLAFYYPIHAVINLFLYVLKFPLLPTAAADLGLLDVAAGHFGYIEFLTASKVSISLPREAANIASKVVKAAKGKDAAPASMIDTTSLGRQSNNPRSQEVNLDGLNLDGFGNGETPSNDLGDLMNLDTSGWNLLSSFDMLGANLSTFEDLS